ncbi:MAG: cell division protein FtsQ/DivIB [Spirochaetia bacterium]
MADTAYRDGREDTRTYIPRMHLYKGEVPEDGVGKKAAGIKGAAVQPAVRRSPPGVSRPVLKRIFRGLVMVLFLVLLGEVLFHTVIGSKLRIRRIEVEVKNDLELTNEEILRLAGVDTETYYFSIDPEKIRSSLERYPLIKEASIRKGFPDTLFLNITGRTLLAYSIVDTEAGAVPVAFDEEGVIFQIGSSVEDAEGLIISGVKFNDLELGMRLPGELSGFLAQLKDLKEEFPFLYSTISELKLIRKRGSDFEALLYTTDFAIPVRIGSSIDAQLMRYILMVLDVVTQKEFADGVEEVDFRTGEIVYTMKEG